MHSYPIRSLTRADEAILWTMLYHALYVPPGQAPFPAEIVRDPEIARYVIGWGRPDDRGLLALDDEDSTPIGAVWSRLFSSENRGYGYIDERTPELSAAVLPEYRNQGIGTRLLTRLMAEVESQYSAVSLSVSPLNPAIRLYHRLGFEFVSQESESATMIRRFDRGTLNE
jgi:ribosomal protein S18 acetylase RimI-like enzyme